MLNHRNSAFASELNVRFTTISLFQRIWQEIQQASQPHRHKTVILTADEWPLILNIQGTPFAKLVLFNQQFDIFYLADGWIILAQLKCSLIQFDTCEIWDTFFHIRNRSSFNIILNESKDKSVATVGYLFMSHGEICVHTLNRNKANAGWVNQQQDKRKNSQASPW